MSRARRLVTLALVALLGAAACDASPTPGPERTPVDESVAPTPVVTFDRLGGLTVGGDHLYWSDERPDGERPAAIYAVALAGGLPTQLAQALPGASIRIIGVDGARLYWSEYSELPAVRSVPLAGGEAVDVVLLDQLGAAVLDGSHLYVSYRSGGAIRIGRVKTDGGDVEPIAALPAEAGTSIIGLAVDADAIYGAGQDGAVWRLAKTGGAPQLLAREEVHWLPGTLAEPFAGDAASLYYQARDAEGERRGLTRVAKAGGAPVRLGAATCVRSIAVGARAVYWSDDFDGVFASAPDGGGPLYHLVGAETRDAIAIDGSKLYWTAGNQIVTVDTQDLF